MILWDVHPGTPEKGGSGGRSPRSTPAYTNVSLHNRVEVFFNESYRSFVTS